MARAVPRRTCNDIQCFRIAWLRTGRLVRLIKLHHIFRYILACRCICSMPENLAAP